MFILKNVWNRIMYRKGISFVLIFSIAAGFLCPIYVLGEIHLLNALYRDNLYPNASGLLAVGCFNSSIDSGMEKDILENTGADKIAYECVCQVTAGWKEDLISSVGGVSPVFFQVTPYLLTEGRMFADEDFKTDKNICILKESSRLALMGAGAGDYVTLKGRKYLVAGVVRATRVYADVILPYCEMDGIMGGRSMQHRILFMPLTRLETGALKGQLAKSGIEDVYSVMSVEEEEREVMAPSYRENHKKWLAVGSAVFVFAALGVWIITLGKASGERQLYGIQKALGATDGRLFMEGILQNIALVACAFGLDGAILALPIEKILPFKVEYGLTVFGQILGMGVALVLFMSSVSFLKMKKEIRELIEGEVDW